MPSPFNKRKKGQEAEALACNYLMQKGLKLIEQNYYCRGGEIDLIMEDKGSVVFIEVRMRNNPNFGSGAESVDWRKQRKLTMAAMHFLQHHPKLAQQPARFDVIAINRQQNNTDIQWIENAFQA